MSEHTAVIEVEGLVKSFGRARALDGLDLIVEPGHVHGFLGPNGSGKSTTLRILLGLLKADSGRASVLGADPWRDAPTLHRRLAYVPGDVSLWPQLSGGEALDLLAALRGGVNERRRAELLEAFELDPTKKARSYSKGNRQKVALIAALAAEAELLVLDEPTSGLDPLMEAVFREQVALAHKRGATVLLSSHILSEVEALCGVVSILRGGKVIESGTLSDLRRFQATRVVAEVDRVPEDLSSWPGVDVVRTEGRTVTLDVSAADLTELASRLARCGLRSLSAQPPSLEDLFLREYEDPEQ